MKKLLPKNLISLLLVILILTLIVQNPLPIARMIYKLMPVAQAEEVIRYFEEEAIVDAMKLTNKSVVEIAIYQKSQFENFTASQEKGRATGMIVSKDGLILTNKHVLAKGNAYDILIDGKDVYESTVVVESPINDFALLDIDASNLTAVKLGDSKNLDLGQTVLAIGYAKGEFAKTVTRGVVSGVKREFVASEGATLEKLTDLIQTDAMINNGSSGGPLINIQGEVIGITTAMDTLGRGINFALPIHKAKPMIEVYKKTGQYKPAWLGVYYIMNDEEVKKEYGLPYNYGAYLTSDEDNRYNGVLPDSPAEKAGFKKGDLILEVNSVKVDEDNTLADILLDYQANQRVTFRIYRNGVRINKGVTLGVWPDYLNPLEP